MTKEKAKKRLLHDLSTLLFSNDDLLPDVDEETQEYKAFDAARNELVAEFDRRSAGGYNTVTP